MFKLIVETDELILCHKCGSPATWGVIDGDYYLYACPNCSIFCIMSAQSFSVRYKGKAKLALLKAKILKFLKIR
jgi:hypothetical protein